MSVDLPTTPTTTPTRSETSASNHRQPRARNDAFAVCIAIRYTNHARPRPPENKRLPRWQRGGQGFDPPRLHNVRVTRRHLSLRPANLSDASAMVGP